MNCFLEFSFRFPSPDSRRPTRPAPFARRRHIRLERLLNTMGLFLIPSSKIFIRLMNGFLEFSFRFRSLDSRRPPRSPEEESQVRPEDG
jgi:hypothetical protein